MGLLDWIRRSGHFDLTNERDFTPNDHDVVLYFLFLNASRTLLTK